MPSDCEVRRGTDPHITIEADKCDGRRCIRGYRITVEHLLGLLAEGVPQADILKEWDFLEPMDIEAAIAFQAFDHTSK